MSSFAITELLSGNKLLSQSIFLEARLALVQPGTSTAEEVISQLGVSINTIEQLNVAMLSKFKL